MRSGAIAAGEMVLEQPAGRAIQRPSRGAQHIIHQGRHLLFLTFRHRQLLPDPLWGDGRARRALFGRRLGREAEL